MPNADAMISENLSRLQVPTNLEIVNLGYKFSDGKFTASMKTGDHDEWRFEYFRANKRAKPKVTLWSSDCSSESLACNLPETLFNAPVPILSSIRFGISAICALEEITWLRMCWFLAHYAKDFAVEINSKQRVSGRSFPPTPKTIQAKLGICGFRTFIYFHVNSDVILHSDPIAQDTHRFINERGLEKAIGDAYNSLTPVAKELFVRKGSLYPLL